VRATDFSAVMSGTAQVESFAPLGGDTGEGEALPLQLAPLNPSPETIPGVGTAGDVDSQSLSREVGVKSVNGGVCEVPAQLMSMSSTEAASPFTLSAAAGASFPLQTTVASAAEEEDEGSLL